MVEVVWTESALKDVDSIATFIALDSELQASLQVKRFYQAVEVLQTHPLVGKMIPEFQIRELRELVMGNYRMMYEVVSESRIDILVIHHSRRLLKNNLSFKLLETRKRRKRK